MWVVIHEEYDSVNDGWYANVLRTDTLGDGTAPIHTTGLYQTAQQASAAARQWIENNSRNL